MKLKAFFILGILVILNAHAREIVLIADPRVLQIPIQENHDSMIDLAQQHELAYGPPPIDPRNTDYTKMRKTAYDKLKQAQALLPHGLKFKLYEAHRSLTLQQKIFNERYHELQKANPRLTHNQIFIESTKFVSPVINLDGSKNIPPHTTGAAIDVYLIDASGKAVDMGIDLDDVYKDLTGDTCKTDSTVISEQAKVYRRIMSQALQAAGFVNYPTEYWHWSYGDRYWAFQTHQPFALYGAI